MSANAVLQDLLKEYCSNETNFEGLTDWVFRCLKKSLDNHVSATVKDTYSFYGSSILYIPKTMVFSIIKAKENSSDMFMSTDFYEVGLWVTAYLNHSFGNTPMEALRKELFFSDTDIFELCEEISYDISEWCNNVHLVVP